MLRSWEFGVDYGRVADNYKAEIMEEPCQKHRETLLANCLRDAHEILLQKIKSNQTRPDILDDLLYFIAAYMYYDDKPRDAFTEAMSHDATNVRLEASLKRIKEKSPGDRRDGQRDELLHQLLVLELVARTEHEGWDPKKVQNLLEQEVEINRKTDLRYESFPDPLEACREDIPRGNRRALSWFARKRREEEEEDDDDEAIRVPATKRRRETDQDQKN